MRDDADSPDSRPSVMVETVLLTVRPGQDELQVLLARQPGKGARGEWAVAGTPVRPRERLADAALRCVRQTVELQAASVDQLHVFDLPDAGGREWTLSVTYVVAVPWRSMEAPAAARGDAVRLRPADAVRWLSRQHHGEMVRRAVDHLRSRYAVLPDPAHLLPEPFTIRQLHDLHEAVAPHPRPDERRPSMDTFRRYMVENGLVTRVGGTSQGTVGKPAALYRRAKYREGGPAAFVGVRPPRPVRGRPAQQ